MSKTLTFGAYTTALGNPRGGTIRVGFDDPMLHIPSGEVVVGGVEAVAIDPATGLGTVEVPVTITDELLANWRGTSPYTNQRLRIEIDVTGYRSETLYVDISPLDPPVIDFDQMSKYPSTGGLPVSRAAVASIAGLTGDITAQAAATALQPHLAAGTITEEQMQEISADVQADMEPPIDLVVLFENALT